MRSFKQAHLLSKFISINISFYAPNCEACDCSDNRSEWFAKFYSVSNPIVATSRLPYQGTNYGTNNKSRVCSNSATQFSTSAETNKSS